MSKKIIGGNKTFYSKIHATQLDCYLNYKTVVLSFTDENGKDLLVTWYCSDDGKSYTAPDKIMNGVMTSKWKYNGTQCVGMKKDDSRCTTIMPSGTSNSCTPCWNLVRGMFE